MATHTIAINILMDELDDISRTIRIIRDENVRMGMIGMVQPNRKYAVEAYGVRYRNQMNDLVKRGNAIVAAIQVLKGDSK